jgi:hypothetical protein
MLFDETVVFIAGFAFARSAATAKSTRLVPNDAIWAFEADTSQTIIRSSSAVNFGRRPLRTAAEVDSIFSSSLVVFDRSLGERDEAE